jgi:hypothetical protein
MSNKKNRKPQKVTIVKPRGILYLWYLLGVGIYIASKRLNLAACRMIASVCRVNVK